MEIARALLDAGAEVDATYRCYASGMGRREVVEVLIERGPDLAFREPVHGATALGMARYPHPAAGRPQGNPEVAALLSSR